MNHYLKSKKNVCIIMNVAKFVQSGQLQHEYGLELGHGLTLNLETSPTKTCCLEAIL